AHIAPHIASPRSTRLRKACRAAPGTNCRACEVMGRTSFGRIGGILAQALSQSKRDPPSAEPALRAREAKMPLCATAKSPAAPWLCRAVRAAPATTCRQLATGLSALPALFFPLAPVANPVEVRGLVCLVCPPAPTHDVVARTLNAREE